MPVSQCDRRPWAQPFTGWRKHLGKSYFERWRHGRAARKVLRL